MSSVPETNREKDHGALCPAANFNDVFLKGQVKMLLMYSSKEEVGKLNCFVN